MLCIEEEVLGIREKVVLDIKVELVMMVLDIDKGIWWWFWILRTRKRRWCRRRQRNILNFIIIFW